jgi:hypothetical protein
MGAKEEEQKKKKCVQGFGRKAEGKRPLGRPTVDEG